MAVAGPAHLSQAVAPLSVQGCALNPHHRTLTSEPRGLRLRQENIQLGLGPLHVALSPHRTDSKP